MTSEQLRAARALLHWNQGALAAASKVSIATIKRLEPASGVVRANQAILSALREALEAAGIEFIGEDDGGVGVRFKKPRGYDGCYEAVSN